MIDPSPWVNGSGLEILEAAGIDVSVGEGARVARQLNDGYFTWVQRGRPLVTAIYDGPLDRAHALADVGHLDLIVADTLESLSDEADRLVIERSDLDVDTLSWTHALQSLAGQNVQYVLVDTGVEVLEALTSQGLVDRIAVVPRLTIDDTFDQPRERVAAITVNGLVACSAAS
jgi:hypothetical protein